jgi:hypothetical protein
MAEQAFDVISQIVANLGSRRRDHGRGRCRVGDKSAAMRKDGFGDVSCTLDQSGAIPDQLVAALCARIESPARIPRKR